MAAEFVTSAAANTVGNLTTEYASPYVSYFFRFGKIVEEFKNQRKELELKKKRVKNDVDEATRQTEVIEEDVLNWLESAKKELEETQSLEVEIERKKCFSWCPNWGWRYCLSKKVAKKTLYINKLLERSNFPRVGYRAPLQGIEFLPSKDFMPSESSNSAFSEIIKALYTDNVNMIGLYGMPGVGKTTLAKEVGKHAKEQKLFEYVVMATMSQTLDISKIRNRIAELLGLKFAESTTEEGKAEELWRRLKDVKKILIIIDDVWEEFDLQSIRIPIRDEHDGCKILLTTRRQQVCDQMNCQKKFQLDILSEDEAWALFKDNADLENVPSSLHDVAKEVACECNGLPLAIVTVGKALKGESPDGWKVANQRFKNSRHVDNEDVCEGIYNRLKFSYDYLKGDNFRSCFLLCSLFPEDFDIDIELLIVFGIGYGLFSHISNIEERRLEIREALRKLQDSGLLLKNDDDDDYVSMHDVVRDFAHWITWREKNIFMFKERLTEWPISEGFECYTAISFWKSNIITFPDKLEFRNLKIFVFTGNDLVRVPIVLVKGMEALQVLHLRNVVFSLEIFEFITNLRTLCFEGCELENISSLKNLKNLEILVLSGTDIYELPEELLELRRLKSLHFSFYGEQQCNFPPNLLSRLTSLQELRVTSENDVNLSELNSLSGLTALSLNVSADQCVRENFEFHKLQRYNIVVNGDHLFVNEPTFRTLTRTLTIRDFSTSLSAFKELFCNVEKLALERVVENKNIVSNVDQEGLKELTSLELSFCKDLECLIDTAGEQGFLQPIHRYHASLQNLKVVRISKCNKLKSIFSTCVVQNLLHLEKLTVDECDELEQVFDFPQEVAELEPTHAILQSLKVVSIVDCNKLKFIFSTSVVQRLFHLKELTVDNCRELEQVFDFPQEVTELEPTHRYHASLQSLKVVKIRYCNKLKSIFSTCIVQSLLHLEKLTVAHCDELEQVFDFSQEVVELESTHRYHASLQSLKAVSIFGCNKLKFIFSTSVVQRLFHLKELTVDNCRELEQVFDFPQEVTELEPTHRYHASLQSLKVVKISQCNKLKSIFSTCIVQSLLHLEELTIQMCNELEQVIDFPQEVVELESTHRYHASLQSLKVVKIWQCNKLKSIFSTCIVQSLLHLEELTIQMCNELEQVIDFPQEVVELEVPLLSPFLL